MPGSEKAVRAIIPLAIVLLVLLSWFFGNEATSCIEGEKQALLTFKQDLTDPSNRLSSWINGVDCCEWLGVVCNNITGHVTELHLKNSDPYNINSALGGRLNPSLLHLEQLQVLDLTLNNFAGVPIPSFIGSIHSLRHLYLSQAGFQGVIPNQLGNLSNLQSLNVAADFGMLQVDNIQWLAGLSNLKRLDLSYVYLNEANNLLQVINMIPSLTELYLSWCSLLQISQIVDFNLSSLTILDLSGNGFTSLPRWIFDLKKLVSLDLSKNSFRGPLPEGPWNLTSLNYLDLSQNSLYGTLPRELLNLSTLISLSLSSNYFNNPIPNAQSNLTNLQNLDLSRNNLNTSIPNWLYSCKHLKSLHLEKNQLQGAIREDLGNLSSLVELRLFSNQLSGTIPDTIGKLCNIKSLYLSENKFEGLISDVIDGMAGCFSNSIQYFYLDSNQFSGQLTEKIGQFKNIVELCLGLNSIFGPIPPNVGLLSSLEVFILRDNKINGALPHSFGQLSKLVYLDISRNKMEGIVAQSLLENLTSLRFMLATGNSMTLEVDHNWVPPTQYEDLSLRSWKLGPQFPNWLHSQKNIGYLDLSSTGISGAIPSWIWSLSTELSYLNLSHNHLQGEISSACCIYHLDLSSNQLSGELPHIAFKGMYHLDLSNNSFSGVLSHFLCDQVNATQKIEILNLGKNLLSGEIPDCWMNWTSLNAVNLANNNLTGSIPGSIGNLKQLRFLHLRNNSLSGGIPSSLMNCTSLQAIDLAENKLAWDIPTWLGLSFLDLRILILRSNRFQGELMPELCHLTSLRILDLANNNISGIIPKCFKNFTSIVRGKLGFYDREMVDYGRFVGGAVGYTESDHLATKGNEYDFDIILPFVTNIDLSNNYFSGKIPDELASLLGLKSLNLSGNQLEGMIPMHIGKMVQLESLDLSRNQLSGSIPSSISQLSFLSFLNLSYNNLSGEIPLSSQLQSFNASSFVRNQLCGRPLQENCTTYHDGVAAVEDDGDEGGVDLLYVFMGSGFVVGFWGVYVMLIFKRSWRYAYFHFVDKVWLKIYVISTKYLFKR